MSGLKTARALNKIQKVFHEEEVQMMGASTKAAVAYAEEVIKVSRKYVPVKTGYLYNSARIFRPRVVAGRQVAVNFGYTAPYALAVHARTIPYLSIAISEVDAGGSFQANVQKSYDRRQVRTGVRIRL